MKLINIGFGNMVSAGRVVAVVSPDSAPVKRLVKEARERGMLIDASYGRSTRAVLIMDSDHVVLSALQPETVPRPAAGMTAFVTFFMVRNSFIISFQAERSAVDQMDQCTGAKQQDFLYIVFFHLHICLLKM